MKRNNYRNFVSGVPHHIFVKACEGNIIFYSVKDIIFYFTLYCCLARKYVITANILCIMPNHIHSNESCNSKKNFEAFHCELNSYYSRMYNIRHKRRGALFQSPFGYSPKSVIKRLKDNFCYIANNPVTGHLSNNFLEYRWNFLAYTLCEHHFSCKLPISKESCRVRNVMKKVDYFRRKNIPLNYERLDVIFKNLNKDEEDRIINYIINSYNAVEYTVMSAAFGVKAEDAFKAFNIVSGSEYDLEDDYDDYSYYMKMTEILEKAGVDFEKCNFEKCDKSTLMYYSSLLKKCGARHIQICKFLHLTKCLVLK